VDSDWFNDNNWTAVGVPGPGDDVVVPSTTTAPVLTNATAALNSFAIGTNTLTFTNWNSALNAVTVNVLNNGILTSSTNSVYPASNTNRVYIICTDLTVASGGTIHADAKGFIYRQGPGKGTSGDSRGGGGGYGGRGGRGPQKLSLGGAVYGSVTAPEEPGSGGDGAIWLPTYDYGPNAGSGGGVVRIQASGTVTVNGTVSANGGNGIHYAAGGGSGGSIYISCSTFDGSGGTIRANGGSPPADATLYSGAGGGGRIAVTYTTASGTCPRFSAAPGRGWANAPDTGNGWDDMWSHGAGMGTVYLSDAALLASPLVNCFATNYLVLGVSSWSPTSLIVSNCTVSFAGNGFKLSVQNDLTIGTNGSLGIGAYDGDLSATGCSLVCGQNLVVTNGGALYAYGGATNSAADNVGTLVRATNDIVVAASSWIYPFAQFTNGGTVLFRANNVRIAAGGGFNAKGRGFGMGFGDGKGTEQAGWNRAGGGGYGGGGGKGESALSYGGSLYGLTNAPVAPGSGGGFCTIGTVGYPGFCLSGAGGGAVRIQADGTVSVDGAVNADGGKYNGPQSGGGSGGTIFIDCAQFSGAGTGALYARGGNADTTYGGAGGGGRIAVWIAPGGITDAKRAILNAGGTPTDATVTNSYANFLGSLSVTNGTGLNNGTNGSLVFIMIPPPARGTLIELL
jgi:hypothetical protein